MKKLVNYDYVDMTAGEVEELNLMAKEDAEQDKIRTEAKEKKVADKASGNQKLKDLGLTDDEISALTG